jgi:hypothetical protein
MTPDIFLIRTKSTVSITYFHLTRICYMFGSLCTSIREINCDSSLKNISSNSSWFFKELANAFSLMKQIKVKGKVYPRRGHEGPEEDYMCNYTLSSTSALDEGGWSKPRPGRFTPVKTWYPLYRRLRGPQGRSGRVRKISPPSGIDPGSSSPQRFSIPTGYPGG